MTILNIPPTYANITEWVRNCARAVNQLIALFGPPLAVQSVKFSVRNTTLSVNVSTEDYLITADATGGAVTVTLPPVSSGRVIVVKKLDASVNNVIVDGNGAETIDGAANKALTTQYASIMVMSGATEWHVI